MRCHRCVEVDRAGGRRLARAVTRLVMPSLWGGEEAVAGAAGGASVGQSEVG